MCDMRMKRATEQKILYFATITFTKSAMENFIIKLRENKHVLEISVIQKQITDYKLHI